MSQPHLQNLSSKTGLSTAELAKRAEQLVDTKTGKIPSLSALDAALMATATSQPNRSVQDAFAAMGATTASTHVIDDPAHAYSHGDPQGGYAPEPPAVPTVGGPIAALEKAAKLGVNRISGFCGGAQPPPAQDLPPSEPLTTSPEGRADNDCAPNTPPPQSGTALSTQSTATTSTGAAPVGPAVPSTTRRSISQAASMLQDRMGQRVRGFEAGSGAGGAPAPLEARAAGVQGELDNTSRAIQFELIKNEIQKMTQLQNAVSNTLATMHEQAMTAIRAVKA